MVQSPAAGGQSCGLGLLQHAVTTNPQYTLVHAARSIEVCTLHNIVCTMDDVVCRLRNVVCTMHNVRRTINNVMCTLNNVACTLRNVVCRLPNVVWTGRCDNKVQSVAPAKGRRQGRHFWKSSLHSSKDATKILRDRASAPNEGRRLGEREVVFLSILLLLFPTKAGAR